MWKDAIWLAKKEFRQHWVAVVFTFIFSMIIGYLAGIILSGSQAFIVEFNNISVNIYLLDFLIIAVAPGFGAMYMAKPYFSYKEAVQEPFGKRMAVLRSLPISVSVLALSRIIVMLVILLLNSLALFGIMTTILMYTGTFSELMNVGEYIMFICLWLGYILALGGISPFMEYGLRGRFLHIIPFVYMAIFLAVVFSFYYVVGSGIVASSINIIKNGAWLLGPLALIIGMICCYLWNQLLMKRLANRDYV